MTDGAMWLAYDRYDWKSSFSEGPLSFTTKLYEDMFQFFLENKDKFVNRDD